MISTTYQYLIGGIIVILIASFNPLVGMTAFVCGIAVAHKYCQNIEPKESNKIPPVDQIRNRRIRKPKVLFFPDQKLPCKSFYNRLMKLGNIWRCYRNDCPYLHENDWHKSSLIQIFLALNTAQRQIDICMYILTNRKLAEFLVHLKRTRGIRVRLITDCGNSGTEHRIGDLALTLAEADLEVRTNAEGSGSLMHNKFVIIDNKKLITGSFNWTMNAIMKNDEAIIIMSDKDITRAFASKFHNLWNTSKVPTR